MSRGRRCRPCPGRSPRTARARAVSWRSGFTLVEILVALALAGLVATVLLASVRIGARAGSIVGGRAEAGHTGLLATSLLRFEIERAGRVHGGLRLDLDPLGAGGDRIGVRYVAEAYRAEPVDVEAVFFAAVDGAGRPNLYRLPPTGSRQPWLLNVTGLHVVAAIGSDGTRLERASLAGEHVLSALVVEVRFADGGSERFIALTARAGAVVVAIGA